MNTNGATTKSERWTPPERPVGVEDHEAAEAKALVDQQFVEITGDTLRGRACGYLIAVKIYVRPEEYKTITDVNGVEQTIYLPGQSSARDRYASVAALVVGMGQDAYKGVNADGSPRYPNGPWCKIGDWIIIPRYECFQVTYREKVAMGLLADDKVAMVIEDPNDFTAANIVDRM